MSDGPTKYLTSAELAAEFGVSSMRISQLERKGVLPPALRVGKSKIRLWPRADLDRIREAFDARNTIPGRRIKDSR